MTRRGGLSKLVAGAADPVLWGLAALGAAAVLFTLGEKHLANDEGASYFIAQLDPGRLWESLAASEANGSLFYVTLHAWIGLGDSEFFMRLLPAFFGAATIPVVYLLGRRLDSRTVGIAAALITTLSFYFIKHAQELRSYSLSLLLSTLASLILITSLQDRRREWWRWAIYSFVAAAAVYAHFFSAFVLASHALGFLAYPNKRELVKQVLASFVAIGILISPLAYFAAFKDVGQVDWIAEPSASILLDATKEMSGVQSTAALALPLGLALIGIWSAFRSRGRDWTNFMLLGWALIPFFASFAISFAKPLFEARYLLVSLSALTIWQARGLIALKPFVLRAVVGIALAAILLQGTFHWYDARQEGKHWERIGRHIKRETKRGDAALFYAPTVMRAAGYYLGYYEANSGKREPPPSIYPNVGWLGFSKTRFNPDMERLTDLAAEYDRLWWVRGADNDSRRREEKKEIKLALQDICTDPPETSFRGAVMLFTGCSRN